LPVNKYKSLADKWNYILIGSNNSKNGLTMQKKIEIGNELVDEAIAAYPVSKGEIMLCGFSGGARAASGIGAFRDDIKGVICNSAAPGQPMPGKVYVGLAGLGDMNYLEMKKFETMPSDPRITHELLLFDGEHEWAPVSAFENAMLISGCAPVDGKRTKDDSTRAAALAENILSQIDSVKNISCTLARNLLETGERVCTPFGSWKKENAALVSDACVKSDEAAWKKLDDQENAMQVFLSESILTRDTAWWRQNAETYFDTTKTGPEKFMRARLRGYISLTCYTYANQAFHTTNLHAAEKMVKVYSIVDPSNSEWAYMQAMLYVKLGLNEYVMPALKQAVELGFRDVARLQSDANFDAFRNDPVYNELVARMKV
jgi:hypothetical protein